MLSQNKKILILVSFFILVIMLFLLLLKYAFNNKKITQSPNQGITNKQITNTQDSKSLESVLLSLQTPQTNIEKNSQFIVDVYLDTKNLETRSADISLKFDPNYLEVVDADSVVTGTQVTPGTILSKPMILRNQADNSTGQIFLSISSLTPFNGKGIFGTIKFETKNLAISTKISFVANPETKISKAGADGQIFSLDGLEEIILTIK